MMEEMSFQVSLDTVRDSAFRMGGGVVRWMKMFWRVILSLSVKAPLGVAH